MNGVTTRYRSDCSYSLVPTSAGAPPPLTSSPPFFLSWTEELVKASTCAHDRRLYAVSGGWLNSLSTSVRACRRLYFFRKEFCTRNVEGWYRRLKINLSSAIVTVRLQYLLLVNILTSLELFNYALGVVFTDDEVSHFIGLLREMCIIRTQAAKSDELGKWDTVFGC